MSRSTEEWLHRPRLGNTCLPNSGVQGLHSDAQWTWQTEAAATAAGEHIYEGSAVILCRECCHPHGLLDSLSNLVIISCSVTSARQHCLGV